MARTVAAPSDIVVVGAGIVGCAVAYELARRGASVQIVDDRPAGHGRDAGVGRRAGAVHRSARRPIRCSISPSAASISSTSLSPRVAAASGVDVPVPPHRHARCRARRRRRCGALERAARTLRRARCRRASCSTRQARAARSRTSRKRCVGGLLVPAHGFVAAAELTRALAGRGAAPRRPADRAAGACGESSATGSDLGVETDRGSLSGNGVVLAAGSWSGQIDVEGADGRVPVRPVRGQLLAARVDRAAAPARHLGRALLSRAVGRRNAAGRRDGRGRRVRRADDGGGRPGPDRSGLRARAARVDGRVHRGEGRAAAGDAR